MQHDDRLIVALDFPTLEQAKNCVLELGETVSHYKVGMELLSVVIGPQFLQACCMAW